MNAGFPAHGLTAFTLLGGRRFSFVIIDEFRIPRRHLWPIKKAPALRKTCSALFAAKASTKSKS
jgi:hypothetical protein